MVKPYVTHVCPFEWCGCFVALKCAGKLCTAVMFLVHPEVYMSNNSYTWLRLWKHRITSLLVVPLCICLVSAMSLVDLIFSLTNVCLFSGSSHLSILIVETYLFANKHSHQSTIQTYVYISKMELWRKPRLISVSSYLAFCEISSKIY